MGYEDLRPFTGIALMRILSLSPYSGQYFSCHTDGSFVYFGEYVTHLGRILQGHGGAGWTRNCWGGGGLRVFLHFETEASALLISEGNLFPFPCPRRGRRSIPSISSALAWISLSSWCLALPSSLFTSLQVPGPTC